MSTINVAIVNGIRLQVVAENSEQLVAVKPVCEILGVAYQPQIAKLKEHPVYGSTITLSVTVGADGKDREMACIPLRYFPSWLFSINPNNVKEEVREHLIEYQMKCNDILYDYFFSRVDFSRKKEEIVYNWIAGRSTPDPLKRKTIAGVVGIPEQELFPHIK